MRGTNNERREGQNGANKQIRIERDRNQYEQKERDTRKTKRERIKEGPKTFQVFVLEEQ